MPIESKADALIALREVNEDNERLRAEVECLKEELRGTVTTKYHDEIVAEANKSIVTANTEIRRLTSELHP